MHHHQFHGLHRVSLAMHKPVVVPLDTLLHSGWTQGVLDLNLRWDVQMLSL